MDTHPPELMLLLACSRLEPGSCVEEILRTAPGDIDWTVLVMTALDHGVTGLLCNSLLTLPDDMVPLEIIDAAKSYLHQAESSNQALADQLSGALDILHAAGIETIPFKGPSLALSAYHRLALRTFRDLDFLIREKDIELCLSVLRTIGYSHDWNLTPRQWQEFVHYAGEEIVFGEGVPCEPHWAFAPHTLAIRIDYDKIWQLSIRKSFNGRTILSLAPEDELIVLCVHGSKEKWSKLKWVADVAEFVRSHPALDWSGLFSRAEAQGIARMLRLGLSLAKQLLDAPIPLAISPWLDADRVGTEMSQQLSRSFFEHRTETEQSIYEISRFHWAMRERFSDRWRYFYRTVTQPRVQHFGGIRLPDSLFFLYVPYKLVHDYIALPIWKRAKPFLPWLKAQAADPDHRNAS